MKKLLLATILAIPAMGYCGFIDWLTGYPEVKEKIEQGLEKKYNGEKFEVSGVSYSSNLGGYNFYFVPKDNPDDEYGGSYYPDSGVLAANGYMWSSVGKQWRAMVEPEVAKLSNDYLLMGGMGSRSPRVEDENSHEGLDIVNKVLSDLFDGMSTQEWIAKDHNYIAGNIQIYIDMPKNAESVFKLLKLVKNINDKYQRMQLNEYYIKLNVFKFPKDFEGLEKYWDYHSKHVYTSTADFPTDYNLQKYIWLESRINGCPKTNRVLKYCNTQYGQKNEEKRKEQVAYLTLGNRLSTLDDIVKQFRYYPKTSYKKYGNLKLLKDDSISFTQSPYWSQVQTLINQGDK
ncbi:hypothetical protein IBE10_07395 [Francisella tularensis subsp. novicida]|uniref:hypothetical protein n=1 Tax=Francisella tularensis TaxID=263 RepID=UPI0008FD299F|nr:hypothetical protein [Francisella tularensis]APC94455.1 putative lipoprotein [Francisella tularensis subsp. novicida]MBK2346743.1 hypothetical protein [Francisella tularensis subsp. novicida]